MRRLNIGEMNEVERTILLLKEILKPYYKVEKIRDDTLLAQSDSEKTLYTVKIFPPTPSSVQSVMGDIISYKPKIIQVVSQIEDWTYAIEDTLKENGISANVKRLSPLDIGSMTAGITPFSEHIGVAVKNLEEAEKKFEDVLGVKPSGRHKVQTEGLTASFIWIGSTRVELLEPFSDDSAVKSFLEKKGEGIHHIAVEIENFDAKVDELQKKGYRIIGPRIGATGKRVIFIHPKDFMGILLELVEKGYREKSFEH